jgi:hypothetical protein
MTDRKIYSRRHLHGLYGKRTDDVVFAPIRDGVYPLSAMLAQVADGGIKRLILCGSKEQMSNEYVNEPVESGFAAFAREYVPKHRSPVYQVGYREVSVKLASESWFPGCEDADIARAAWMALVSEWESVTKLPLLSTPSKTGQALLCQTLPDGEFPSLPDDVASLIRANSFPNRLEWVTWGDYVPTEACGKVILRRCVQYDMRWAFAMFCTLDRFPIGEPRKARGFQYYVPGWHHVFIKVPNDWNHVGLIPRKSEDGDGWEFPATPGLIIKAWVSEPELALALTHGWEIVEYLEGWEFAKGRPLGNWAQKLIAMRAKFEEAERFPISGVSDDQLKDYPDVAKYHFAASAVRNILNHTVGSFHVNGYERERLVSESDWPAWKRAQIEKTGYFPQSEKTEGGRLVRVMVPDNSPLSFYMPHWSAYVWALERAAVAKAALLCDPSTIVKIHGDAIYLTVAQPEIEKSDKGRNGQMRRKA